MKKYISSKTVLVGTAFIALVSASIYFVNPEFSASSSHDHSRLSGTAAEDNIATATSSPKNVTHEVQVSDTQGGAVYLDNNTGREEQDNTLSDKDKDLAMLEKRNQVQLTERDLALPPPSGVNVTAVLTGEYADQIYPQAIFDKAKSEGYLPPEVAPDSHPPSGKNIASESQGENAQEVSQQALIDKAKTEGYLPP